MCIPHICHLQHLAGVKNSELIGKHSTLVGVYPHPWTFRKYTTPMVFREFLKNPTYPKIWGLSAYPLLTISNLTTGIIIFDILSPRAFRKYTTPMVFREFLKNPTYPKIWGLSAYPDTTRHHQTCSRHHQTRTRQYLIGWQWSFVDL